MSNLFATLLSSLGRRSIGTTLGLIALVSGSFLVAFSSGLSDSAERLAANTRGSQGTVVTLANGTISTDGTFSRTFPPQIDQTIGATIATVLPDAGPVSPVVKTPFDRIESGTHQYRVRNIVGVSPAYLQTMGLAIVAGSSFTDSDIASRNSLMLVSEDTAAILAGGSTQAVGSSVNIVMPGPAASSSKKAGPAGSAFRGMELRKQAFTIAGVYHIPDETSRLRFGIGDVLLPYTAASPGGMTVPASFFWGTVTFLNHNDSVEGARTKLRQALTANQSASSSDDIKIALWQGNPLEADLRSADTADALSTFALVVRSIGLVLMLVAGVGMYGIMTVETVNRSRFFGIQRAVGADNGYILRLISAQAGFLALVAAVPGTIAAAFSVGPVLKALSPWFEHIGLRLETLGALPFSFVPYLVSFVAVVGAATVFGTLPGLRFMKVSPISLIKEDVA